MTVFLENVELNPGERFLSVDIQGPPGNFFVIYIYIERERERKENTILPPPKNLTVFLENVEVNPGERFLSVDIQGPPGKKLTYIYI